ncbi:MAG TPA: decaprenyl-phosphate phosphoribosyltransferase [Thermoanaerobaculia bacterium]|nr:decaprenyl-phosphate phosphoribosyltransferase [Thermoanaerobaculia bacterium]
MKAIRLLRPAQWLKNGFVIAPLIFSRSFVSPSAVAHSLAAFVIFCGAASAGYIINDVFDRESDRAHPVKRLRPIAAGEVSVSVAVTIVTILIPILLVAAWFVAPKFLLAVALYLALATAYSIYLKTMPIIDLFAIACGFVLRVWGGAVVIDVVLSVFMFITTLSLALYLAATKRRQELLSTTTASDFRPVLQHYSVKLMDDYSEIAVVATFVFYGLYIATVRPQLAVTVPVVLFGVFRYRYLMERSHDESPTDRMVRDPQMIVCAVLWAAISITVLYLAS